MDGYLRNAQVWVDTTGNNTCNVGPLAVRTGAGGVVELPDEYRENTICIKVIPNETVDESRGVVTKLLTLKSPAGETIVSPLTDLVVEQLVENDTLTVEDAKNAVVDKLGLNNVAVDDVFGDYIADMGSDNAATADMAKAINLIGEVLFDEDDDGTGLTVDEKLAIVEKVSDEAQTAITNNKIDDFAPNITVNGDGTVTIADNSRPIATSSAVTDPQTIERNTLFTLPLASWFVDDNGDALSYEFKVLPVAGANLEIANANELTGTPTIAQTYTVYVHAREDSGAQALSRPVIFELNVTSDNEAPQVDSTVKASIQTAITNLGLTQNEAINQNVSIAGLFTDDADENSLAITVAEAIGGLEIDYADNLLTFAGAPTSHGSTTFTVTAKDSEERAVDAQFTVTIAENAGPHPLENKLWYRLDRGEEDADDTDNYTRVWCDTMKFEGNIAYFNDRSMANRTACTDAVVSAGNYTVDGDGLHITWSDESFVSDLSELRDDFANDGHGTLVKYVEKQSGGDEIEVLTLFENKADAEARITLSTNTPEGNGDFTYYRPTGNTYESGDVSVSLGLPQGDDGELDIDLYFDNLPASNESCETRVKYLFSSFAVARSEYSDTLTAPQQFFDGDEADSCVVDFDLSGATREGQILGVIAYSARSAEMSSLYFNLEQNFLSQVPASGLNDFLTGISATDYLYQASLNEVHFGNEDVAGVSFYNNQACNKNDSGDDVCFAYSVSEDKLTADSETDQFLYVSGHNAFALTEESADLIAWSTVDFSAGGTGWSADQLTGQTWFYVDDDSTSSTADPMMASFAFGNDNNVVIKENGETQTLPWSVTGGVLTIDFPDGDSDLVLDRVNASGDVVLITNSGNGLVHKPLIMTQSEAIATGIYYQCKSAKAALLP